jgi:multisubunit Na+/H+ antiporter MnhE subunit
VIVRSVVLLAIWIALQGELTFGNVVGGVLVIAVLAVLFPSDASIGHRIHPLGLVRYVARLMADLVTSTWTVVVAVVRPTPERVSTEVIEVELSTSSRLVALVVANSITLTPGTLTADVATRPDGTLVLGVHVLGDTDRAQFLASIAALERRVLGAFTPVDANHRAGGAG